MSKKRRHRPKIANRDSESTDNQPDKSQPLEEPQEERAFVHVPLSEKEIRHLQNVGKHGRHTYEDIWLFRPPVFIAVIAGVAILLIALALTIRVIKESAEIKEEYSDAIKNREELGGLLSIPREYLQQEPAGQQGFGRGTQAVYNQGPEYYPEETGQDQEIIVEEGY